MGFKVAVIYFSRRSRLVTLANVIAEGARSVEGAEVTTYRIRDPVNGDVPDQYDEGVLDAPVITPAVVQEADCILIGAPGRQGAMCAECKYFLDSLSEFQTAGCLLKGKVAGAFTSVGGVGHGFGGHEAILQSYHSVFMQHGMLPIGVPPSPVMEDAVMSSPFGVCLAGKAKTQDQGGARLRSLSESEVKLAYSQGEWAAQVGKQLHDVGEAEA